MLLEDERGLGATRLSDVLTAAARQAVAPDVPIAEVQDMRMRQAGMLTTTLRGHGAPGLRGRFGEG